METPITDQFESLNTALPDHISDNDYRNSTQNPADYDYWNSPNENHDLSEPDWIREQREAAALAESEDMQFLEEFGDIQDVSIEDVGEIVSETSLFGQESNLSEKNIFTVEPIQSVDKKAKSKAKIATQYIGFAEGIAGSSTALYAKQAGKYANTGNYSSNDVIFVSIGGRRGNEVVRKQQQDKTIREAVKALDAGATLITDNASYVESNSYNEGEKRLAANLKDRGYNYSETTVDGDLLGVWSKNTNQITPQQEQQAQPSSDNYIIEQVGRDKINEYKNKCK